MIDTSLITKYRQQGMTNNEILSTLSDNDESLKTRVQSHIFDNPALEDWEKEKASEYYLNTKLGKTKTVNEMDRLATASVKSNTDAFKQLKSSPLEYGIETIKNIPSSTGNLIGGVASAVASPLQTGKALFQAGVGGTANTIESIASLAGVKNAEEIFDLSSENIAKAIGDFYVQRYGSVESAAQTLRDDPAGFLSDLGAVVGLTGGVISGGASLAGKMTGTVSRTSSQLGSVAKGINMAKTTGDSLIRAGYNMEPLVMAGKGVIFAGRQGIKGASIVKDIAQKALDPSRVVTKSLRINPTDIQYFTNLGKSELPGEFLLRKGILNSGDVESISGKGVMFTGDTMIGRTKQAIMNDLERLSTKSKTTVDSLLNSVKETYNLVDEVPDAKTLIDEIANIANKYDLREPKKIISEIVNKDRVSLPDINNLKRLAYDFFDTYKKSNIASDSYSAKQIIQYEQSLRKFIEDQANIKGIPDIAILNEDTMKAREILSAMEKADYANLSKGKNTISLVDGLVAMSTLGITGDYFLSIGALSARRIIESTLFKTTFAKYVDKLSSRDFNILRDSMKRGSHTQESKSIFQSVARKTSSEIKSKLDADFENTNGSIRRSQESSLGLEPEAMLQKEIQSSPSTIPQASDTVQPSKLSQAKIRNELKDFVNEYIDWKDNIVKESMKAGDAMDYATGESFGRELVNLRAKGAFKYKSIDLEGKIDERKALINILEDAQKHHEGKPIQRQINEFLDKVRTKGFESDNESFVIEGLISQLRKDKTSDTFYSKLRTMIEDKAIDPQMTFEINGKEYSILDLSKQFEDGYVKTPQPTNVGVERLATKMDTELGNVMNKVDEINEVRYGKTVGSADFSVNKISELNMSNGTDKKLARNLGVSDNDFVGYTASIYIEPKFQKQGIGSSIMKNAEIKAMESGASGYIVSAVSDNARPFFKKLGYEELESTGIFYKKLSPSTK